MWSRSIWCQIWGQDTVCTCKRLEKIIQNYTIALIWDFVHVISWLKDGRFKLSIVNGEKAELRKSWFKSYLMLTTCMEHCESAISVRHVARKRPSQEVTREWMIVFSFPIIFIQTSHRLPTDGRTNRRGNSNLIVDNPQNKLRSHNFPLCMYPLCGWNFQYRLIYRMKNLSIITVTLVVDVASRLLQDVDRFAVSSALIMAPPCTNAKFVTLLCIAKAVLLDLYLGNMSKRCKIKHAMAVS
jgi:hypothetical protein